MDINKPRFELTSIYSDGSKEEPKIVPINEMSFDTNTNRRGFLGAGLVAGVALTLVGESNLFANSISNKNSNEHFKDKELYAHCGSIDTLAINPDGKILASGSWDKTIKLWSLPHGKLLKTLKDHSDIVSDLSISPDGKTLASGSHDKTIKLWSLPEGVLLATLEGHTQAVVALSISPDGKILASRLYDKTIELWSLPEGNLLSTLEGYPISALAISPDGKILISGSSGNSIKLCSLPEGNLLKTLEGHSSGITALSISPDGKILASGSYDKTIKLWSLPEGKLLSTLEGHTTNTLSISPDGKILASVGSYDKTIKLWALPEGNLLSTLEGHSYGITAFSPDGKILASADYPIKLWSMPEGNLLKTFEEHSNRINALAINPDGKILASASTDQTIRLWDLEKKEFISFLFDPACNQTKGVTYNVYDKVTGLTRTYTLPCGSPVPSGAICTCNCVAGTYKPPVYQGGGTNCTCNKVCTCIPVCQAHKLLHPDKFVRLLSRQILLFMGIKEIDYMNWAAENSKTRLRTAITSLIKVIKREVQPNYKNWPAIKECQKYLEHDDEVISVMAAQMISLQHNFRQQPISKDTHQIVELLLAKSQEMHWKKNKEYGHK